MSKGIKIIFNIHSILSHEYIVLDSYLFVWMFRIFHFKKLFQKQCYNEHQFIGEQICVSFSQLPVKTRNYQDTGTAHFQLGRVKLFPKVVFWIRISIVLLWYYLTCSFLPSLRLNTNTSMVYDCCFNLNALLIL